jgi:hypothetical protein
MKRRETSDPALTDAYRLVSQDDEQTPIPARLESAVMEAWDAHAGGRSARRDRAVRLAWAAALLAAASVALAAALWLQRSEDTRNVQTIAQETAGPSDWYGLESIASPDVLLQDDPASLRLVRLNVQPAVLTAFGYPVADPVDPRPVSVEVLVGLDGVPRAIRRLDAGGRTVGR